MPESKEPGPPPQGPQSRKADAPEAEALAAKALARQGRLAEALAIFDTLVAAGPTADLLNNRATVLQMMGRFEAALADYNAALALDPTLAPAQLNKAGTLLSLGRLDEALLCCDQALAIRADWPKAHYNRAQVCQALGHLKAALGCYDRALELQSDYPEAWTNRGNVLSALGQLDAALQSHASALRYRANYAEALTNYGSTLLALGRLDEALDAHDEALRQRPDLPAAHSNRGTALQQLGRFEAAAKAFEAALHSKPTYGEAQLNRGLLSLLQGRLSEGWDDYELRWCKRDLSNDAIAGRWAPWPGPASLADPASLKRKTYAGKSLLIYDEQGLGDTIQCLRYLPLFAATGLEVTLLVPRRLHRLIRRNFANIELCETIAATAAFDFQIAMMSLPRAFGTTLETIPWNGPYLSPEPDLQQAWGKRLGSEGLKIGLCWQGNPEAEIDRGRSIPLASFAPLSTLPDVRLISLQKNHGLEQLSHLPKTMAVERYDDDLDRGPDGFIDSAALLAHLDYVVTSDTAMAHLAGALGRPTCVALKQVPDWRWLLERSDTPWYPSLRLFRQATRGDWEGVFEDIAKAIRNHRP